jgi:hypothetical protein
MNKTTCPVCNAPQYKQKGKKVYRKVVWYFLLIPCLQRYFVDPKEARIMRWNAERKEAVLNDQKKKWDKDVVLTHPPNDAEYHSFGAEPRNIRLGATTDRLNLFGSQSNTHTTWPLFVWIYNLPS